MITSCLFDTARSFVCTRIYWLTSTFIEPSSARATEVGSLAEVDRFMTRTMGDKEFTSDIYAKFIDLVVPRTYSLNMWTAYP